MAGGLAVAGVYTTYPVAWPTQGKKSLGRPPSAFPYLILKSLGEHEEKKLIGAILDALAGQNGLSLDRNPTRNGNPGRLSSH